MFEGLQIVETSDERVAFEGVVGRTGRESWVVNWVAKRQNEGSGETVKGALALASDDHLITFIGFSLMSFVQGEGFLEWHLRSCLFATLASSILLSFPCSFDILSLS